MATLVNLTNSTITVYEEDGESVLFELPTDPPSASAEEGIEEADRVVDSETGVEIPVVRHRFDYPQNVPDPEDGVVYVVGYAVLQALGPDRPDCVAPDTGRGSAVRGPDGRIRGVRRFRTL